MKVLHVLKVIGSAIVYLVVNVAISVVVVAVYAYFVNPGHPNEFYEEFAKFSAPYSSVIAGMPLMFVWCWWLSKWWSLKSIIGIWVTYVIIDLSVLFGSGMTSRLAFFASISLSTKLIAAHLGNRVRRNNKSSQVSG